MRKLAGLILLLCGFYGILKASEPCEYMLPVFDPPQSCYEALQDSIGYTIWMPNLWIQGTEYLTPGWVDMYIDSTYSWLPCGECAPALKIPVYATVKDTGNPDLFQAYDISIEYDDTVLDFDHVVWGNWGGRCQWMWPIFGGPYTAGQTWCQTSENSSHHTSELRFTDTCGGEGIYPSDGKRLLFTIYFTWDGDPTDPAWPEWDTVMSISPSCLLAVPPVQERINLVIDGCEVGPGDPGFSMKGSCIVFDYANNNTEFLCTESNVGRQCLGCIGCNYWGECWSEDDIIDCNKWPDSLACHHITPP